MSKANESAQASKAEQAPTQPVTLTDEKIHSMFADTLAKEPAPPERYLRAKQMALMVVRAQEGIIESFYSMAEFRDPETVRILSIRGTMSKPWRNTYRYTLNSRRY